MPAGGADRTVILEVSGLGSAGRPEHDGKHADGPEVTQDAQQPEKPAVSDAPRRIVRNAARCLDCGDVIESKHRHDFRWCSCENVAVDGGRSYLKRCFMSDRWEELSESEAA